MWYCLKGVDLKVIWEQALKLNWFWVVVTFSISLASSLLRSMRWVLLIKATGHKSRELPAFASILSCYLANTLVPRMGEVTRCGVLSRTEKVPFQVLLGTVVTERVFDLLTMIPVMLLGLFLEWDQVMKFMQIQSHGVQIPWEKIKSAGLILSILLALAIGAYLFFFRKGKVQLPNRLKVLLTGLWEGIKSIKNLKNPGLFLIYTVLIWVCYWLASYLILKSCTITDMLGPGAGLYLMVLGALAIILPVQGGIGVYHFIISQGILVYGIPLTDGVVYATITHVLTTLWNISIGGVGFLYLVWLEKKEFS